MLTPWLVPSRGILARQSGSRVVTRSIYFCIASSFGIVPSFIHASLQADRCTCVCVCVRACVCVCVYMVNCVYLCGWVQVLAWVVFM